MVPLILLERRAADILRAATMKVTRRSILKALAAGPFLAVKSRLCLIRAAF
jgi:hypothetical protein